MLITFPRIITDRDRRMQQRWLKKQLSDSSRGKASSNIAGEWNKANGDLADFLKKVQESGGTVDSATLIHTSPPCQGYSGVLHAAKKVADADKATENNNEASEEAVKSLKEMQEPAKAEEDATREEGPNIKMAPPSPVASHDESFLSEADGNGSIAEAIGRT